MFEALMLAMMVQTAPVAADPPKVSDGEKIVCKSQKFVGTNIRERICKKKSEWGEGSYAAKSALEGRAMYRQVKGQDGTGGGGPPLSTQRTP